MSFQKPSLTRERSILVHDHSTRHMRNAEEWVQAVHATSYQGHVPAPEQLQKETSHGFTAKGMGQMEAFVQR